MVILLIHWAGTRLLILKANIPQVQYENTMAMESRTFFGRQQIQLLESCGIQKMGIKFMMKSKVVNGKFTGSQVMDEHPCLLIWWIDQNFISSQII